VALSGALRFFLADLCREGLTACINRVFDELQGFGNRINNRQAVVGDHSGEPAQRRAADHVAVQLGLSVLVIEGNQRAKTHHVEEVQVTEINDQRSVQPRKAADCLAYKVGVGRVDFAVDA